MSLLFCELALLMELIKIFMNNYNTLIIRIMLLVMAVLVVF